MDNKLIKIDNGYVLVQDIKTSPKYGDLFLSNDNIIHNVIGYNYGDRIIKFSTNPNHNVGKLSMINCQCIEYDCKLDDLLKINYPSSIDQESYIKGIIKSNEFNGDKLYTLNDLKQALSEFGQLLFNNDQNHINIDDIDKYSDDVIKKFNKKYEWDVIIEKEYIGECNGNNDDGCFMNSCGHDCGCFELKYKLDFDQSIILKRK